MYIPTLVLLQRCEGHLTSVGYTLHKQKQQRQQQKNKDKSDLKNSTQTI